MAFSINFLMVLYSLAFLPEAHAQLLNSAFTSAKKNSSKITVLSCKADEAIFEASGYGEWDRIVVEDCNNLKEKNVLAGKNCHTQRYVITPKEGWQISELYYSVSSNLPTEPSYNSASLVISINRVTGDYSRIIKKTSNSVAGAATTESAYGKCTLDEVQRKF